MRYRLRTLLIVLALGPPLVALSYKEVERRQWEKAIEQTRLRAVTASAQSYARQKASTVP
jgi:hypothetical protein